MPERVMARIARGLGYVLKGGDPQSWFGPQQPLPPMAPPEVAGRQFDYPFGFNQAITPRHREPTGFLELRGLADSYDLLRSVIETRKDQIERLTWRIRLRDGVAGNAAKDPRVATISTFFARPDRQHAWPTWLRMLLEDLLVIDAPTLYLRRTRGGQLWALEPLDGATIKRLIDDWGRTPAPPAPAYQQILKGVPAVDYTADELIYAPRNRRIDLIVIDAGTGAAAAIAGTPGSLPVAPGIPAGKRQVALVSVPNGTTLIGNANITDLRAVWGGNTRGIPWAVAAGTPDAITATYTPATPNPIPDGYILGFRALGANAITAPTFNPDSRGNDSITKQGGLPLVAGDIPGNLAECLLRRNGANARWELMNPAATSPFTTGDVKTTLKTVADSGWVMMNDGTIGDASSGATTRANSDCQPLFTLLWNNVSNANCPVSGGRGASAAADFSAHKSIALPRILGRALASAGAGSSLSARGLADTVGAETHTLSTGEMPSHSHGISDPGHAHSFTAPSNSGLDAGSGAPAIRTAATDGGTVGFAIDAATTGVLVAAAGSGAPHNNMQPTAFLNFTIKL